MYDIDNEKYQISIVHEKHLFRFTSKIFHPNIYPDGRVCISILHPPGDDPLGYEKSSERWSPVQSVEKILLSVMSMIAEPNINRCEYFAKN